MSAIGPKQTSTVALHMSAFGGKADNRAIGKLHLHLRLQRKHAALHASRLITFAQMKELPEQSQGLVAAPFHAP